MRASCVTSSCVQSNNQLKSDRIFQDLPGSANCQVALTPFLHFITTPKPHASLMCHIMLCAISESATTRRTESHIWTSLLRNISNEIEYLHTEIQGILYKRGRRLKNRMMDRWGVRDEWNERPGQHHCWNRGTATTMTPITYTHLRQLADEKGVHWFT